MANELSTSFTLNFVNGTRKAFRKFTDSVDVTGTDYVQMTQNIGTSEETLSLPADIGTPGYMLFINQDATNFVEIGPATGVYFIKLKAGEAAMMRATVAANSFYCKADTAAVDLEVICLED